MSWEICDHTAYLQLHVSSATTPQIRRHCARCEGAQPFQCSGKFRVNANGKVLDVWLIYRCHQCDTVWNHPVHERRAANNFDATELQALMQNDPDLVHHHASDAGRLHAAGAIIIPPRDLHLRATILRPARATTTAIQLSIDVAPLCQVRLDRLVAWALSLQRPEIRALQTDGALQIRPPAAKALKRAAQNGQQIHLCLATMADLPRERLLDRISLGLSAEQWGTAAVDLP